MIIVGTGGRPRNSAKFVHVYAGVEIIIKLFDAHFLSRPLSRSSSSFHPRLLRQILFASIAASALGLALRGRRRRDDGVFVLFRLHKVFDGGRRVGEEPIQGFARLVET